MTPRKVKIHPETGRPIASPGQAEARLLPKMGSKILDSDAEAIVSDDDDSTASA